MSSLSSLSGPRMVGIGLVLSAALVPAMLLGYAQARDSAGIQGSGINPSLDPRAPISAASSSAAPRKIMPWEGAGIRGQQVGPAAQPSPAPPADAPTSKQPGVAVVELFTSEGCSSCPPAERLLSDLAAAADREHTNVILLSFQVDYWDKLGWKDPWASPDNTARQHAYAKAFNTSEVYTPQMVVNGRAGFVGSDRAKASDAIGAALATKPGATITLKPTFDAKDTLKAGDTIRVEYEVAPDPLESLPRNVTLCLAITEDGLTSAVKKGENQGKTLAHDRVVRAFAEIQLNGAFKGAAELRVRDSGGGGGGAQPVKLTNARLTAYAQLEGKLDRRVIAACTTKLAAPVK